MLEGFDFGTPKIASQLTGTLAALKHYHALSIPPEVLSGGHGTLARQVLECVTDAVLHPASLSAERAATEQKAAAGAAPAVQKEELTSQQWFERGFVAVDINEQLRFYTEAIRLKPDYAEAYNNRGNARLAKGDVDGALQDCTEASGSSPTLPTPTAIGAMRPATKATWRALDDFAEALRLGYKPQG